MNRIPTVFAALVAVGAASGCVIYGPSAAPVSLNCDSPPEQEENAPRAQHVAADVVAQVGKPFDVDGKFAHGVLSKDMEHEEVRLQMDMDGCGKWITWAKAKTDSDGRVKFTVDFHRFREPGTYRYRLFTDVDKSWALGTIYLVEKGRHAVFFDVDGTLTVGNSDLAKQMLKGGDPFARAGAQIVVQHYASAGVLPIYVTGRPYWLQRATQVWLERHGFAKGPVITSDRVRNLLPTRGGVGKFKQEEVSKLTADGTLKAIAAYGNVETDACAYLSAGVEPSNVYIVGATSAGCGDQPVQPVMDYTQHAKILPSLKEM